MSFDLLRSGLWHLLVSCMLLQRESGKFSILDGACTEKKAEEARYPLVSLVKVV